MDSDTNRRISAGNRSSSRPSRGFTLVELLVVMGIIVILAAVSALAMSGAEDATKTARTRSIITKLDALLIPRYESYRYRRLPVSLPPNLKYPAQARCDLLRELMRMEMPDRTSDIMDAPISHQFKDTSGNNVTIQLPRTALNQSYFTLLSNTAMYKGSTTPQYLLSAKCLYLLVTMGTEEPDVLENFSSSEIATDPNDNYKYFVDGWGNPIAFLRWAPAFSSPLQPLVNNKHVGADQTDPSGFYPANGVTTWTLYPLIYSAGADGAYDVQDDSSSGGFSYSSANNDPFSSTAVGFGTPKIWPPNDASALSGRPQGNYDNVTNHNLAGR